MAGAFRLSFQLLYQQQNASFELSRVYSPVISERSAGIGSAAGRLKSRAASAAIMTRLTNTFHSLLTCSQRADRRPQFEKSQKRWWQSHCYVAAATAAHSLPFGRGTGRMPINQLDQEHNFRPFAPADCESG